MSDEAIEIEWESGVSINTYGRVDFVNTETRVQICEWRDRWSYPGCRKCRLSADVRCIVGIENLRNLYERTRILGRGSGRQ